MKRKNALICYAYTLKERLDHATLNEEDGEQLSSLASALDDLINKYSSKEIDDTSFLIGIKEIHYRLLGLKGVNKDSLLLIVRRELSQTLASSDDIAYLEKQISICKGQEMPFENIKEDLIHHWQLASETSAARGRIASHLGGILMAFLCAYMLFPILESVKVASISDDNNSSVIFSVHKFMEVFGSFDQFQAIVLGGIGAIISIAISMGNTRELNIFEVAYFSPITFGRLLTGIWAALIMSLIFRGLFDGIVNSNSGTGDLPEPLLLDAMQSLAMFSAGFSERFFDRLSKVASDRLGFEFSEKRPENRNTEQNTNETNTNR